MKKSVYRTIIWTITIACIVFGSHFQYKRVQKSIKEGLSDWDISFENDDLEGNYDISKALESFTELEIDGKVMEVTLEKGSEFHIKADYSHPKLEPVIDLSNNKLKISQKGTKVNGNNFCRVTINIPESRPMSDVEINTNVGQINISDITSNRIYVETNVGEITLKNNTAKKLKAETNVGQIELRTAKSLSSYDISAKADLGEIKVEGKNFKRSYNSNSTSEDKISLKTNVGEIHIN